MVEPKQKNSHLFTMFRMRPTTNKPIKKKKKPEKKDHPPEIEYRHDSDCDSGVDVGEFLLSSKTEMTRSAVSAAAAAAAAEAPGHSFITAQRQEHSSAVCFDNIATPSSIIDQSLLATSLYWPSLDNIPQFNNSVELLYSDLLFDTSASDHFFLPSSFITQSPIPSYQYH